MQSKSTFPARIAPFSVLEPLPFSRVGLRKARFEREMLIHMYTYRHTHSKKCHVQVLIYNLIMTPDMVRVPYIHEI